MRMVLVLELSLAEGSALGGTHKCCLDIIANIIFGNTNNGSIICEVLKGIVFIVRIFDEFLEGVHVGIIVHVRWMGS